MSDAVFLTPQILSGKSVLITGGTGTFGTAFATRCLNEGASKVVIFSRGEAKQAQMKASFTDGRMRFVIGDVRDATRVMDACRGIDVVVHAAALKRVETCEADVREARATNIDGTANVARACIERGVQRAVFLSTDKAASPCTTYGASKFFAEREWVQSNVYSAGTRTRFSCTRYGNVIGSTGSVVTVFREQAKMGVLAVTDPNMTRFWMTIGDAVDLVVLALREMRGGEIFVPKCGAAPITDLAQAVAPKSAFRVIGIRPGEKLHETLIGADESRYAHDAGDHFVIEPCSPLWESRPPCSYPRVPEGFAYTSESARVLGVGELERMMAA